MNCLTKFFSISPNISAAIGFSCSLRIAKGEKYNPMLKLNTSMVFREKERKYKNIVSDHICSALFYFIHNHEKKKKK